MLTDIQQCKMNRLFTLLDVDGDETVDRMDYAASADRLVNAFGFAPDAAEARTLRERYLRLWDEVTGPMDVDGNERVDRAEFAAGFDELVAQPADGYLTRVAPVADAFFDLMDVNGDNMITQVEYVRMAKSAFQMQESDALAAFARLDLDGNGWLSREELHSTNEEFFRSTDPQARGNWTFGPF